MRQDGRLRLDALTRYTQDVSNDDTGDAQLRDDMAWVVRRTTVDTVKQAVFGEELEFATFCSGLGSRWAERRLEVRGHRGARYEVATLWIAIDQTSGRPRLVGPEFVERYGAAAVGRSVTARLLHGSPGSDVAHHDWPLRRVDFDVFNHVNNAAYWAVIEEFLPKWGRSWTQNTRCTIEYRDGIGPADSVRLAETSGRGMDEDKVGWEPQPALWWLVGDARVAASARLEPLDPAWYAG